MKSHFSSRQLVSYIAPSAPATRRPARGDEPFLRPEFGFTPRWYHQALDIDFGVKWHTDPAYRRDSILRMQAELRKRFPGIPIGQGLAHEGVPDVLTGSFGACSIAAIYGVPVLYAKDNWPNCEHQYLTDEQVDNLEPPDLNANPFMENLFSQLDWIEREYGRIVGFINWQGVLNNAQRLRGEKLFLDMLDNPERCLRLFDAICTTMIDAARLLHQRQKESGFEVGFFTVSNCLVNMISPVQYRELLLPFDKKLSETFGCLGVHNCAWTADPYLNAYAEIPDVAYIDMGIDSDLQRARQLFPAARRAIMYTPMDLANKPIPQIRQDLERIAQNYGPCDIVMADIDHGTPDSRVHAFHDICAELSERYS